MKYFRETRVRFRWIFQYGYLAFLPQRRIVKPEHRHYRIVRERESEREREREREREEGREGEREDWVSCIISKV